MTPLSCKKHHNRRPIMLWVRGRARDELPFGDGRLCTRAASCLCISPVALWVRGRSPAATFWRGKDVMFFCGTIFSISLRKCAWMRRTQLDRDQVTVGVKSTRLAVRGNPMPNARKRIICVWDKKMHRSTVTIISVLYLPHLDIQKRTVKSLQYFAVVDVHCVLLPCCCGV